MSAFTPEADIRVRSRQVRLVPKRTSAVSEIKVSLREAWVSLNIDRLFPDYVTQESAGKDTVHFALTEKGHRLVERALKAGRHYYCWQFLSRLNAVHVCASVRVAHRHDGRTIPFA